MSDQNRKLDSKSSLFSSATLDRMELHKFTIFDFDNRDVENELIITEAKKIALSHSVKSGFGNWILGFGIYLSFGACYL